MNLKQERIIRPKKHADKSDLIILSFTWSDRQERIGAVLKDFTISFWDAHDNFTFEKNFNISNFTAEYQTNIWYVTFCNTWLTTDRNNLLYEWDIENEYLLHKHKSEKITSTIIDVREISHLKIIAVASLDKKVTLWNLDKSMIIIDIDMTQGGVHTLKYFLSYQILIIAGYQNSIPIFWVHPHYFDHSLVGKLIGHSSMVTAVDVVEDTPMIVSSDDGGNIKIWDVRNLKCIQTLSIGTRTVFHQVMSIPQWDCIALIGSRVNIMNFDEPLANKNQEENLLFPLKLEYNYVSEDLYVCTRKDIRVISLYDGRMKKVLRGLLESTDDELTAFRFFEQNRKFIVGDHKGNLRIYLTESGELLKKLKSHKNEVTTVFVDFVNKLFISAGCDGLLLIQRETKILRELRKAESMKKADTLLDDYYKKYLKNPHSTSKLAENQEEATEHVDVKNRKGYEVKRSLKNCFNGHEITILEVSIYHNLIITCSLTNKIYFWDYEFCRILVVVNLADGEEPSAVNIVNGPCIISVFTNHNRILLFSLAEDQKNIKFWGELESSECVCKSVSDINEGLLVCGTNKGCIEFISMTELIKACPKIPPASKRTNYNPLRFDKKSFESELERGKVPQIFTNSKVENGILIDNGMVSSSNENLPKSFLIVKGHKDSITSLMFLEMNCFCVVSTSLDGYIRFWECKTGALIASFSTNHPLPVKWSIFPDKSKKLKRNIMFALKIIDLIGKRHRKDITPSEASYLNLNIFLTSISKDHQGTLKEMKEDFLAEISSKVTILREEYSPRDLQYKRVKNLYERELKGPALKEMEATKRVNVAHKAWKQAIDASNVDETNMQKQYQSMMDNLREYESLAFFDPDYKEKIMSNLLKEGVYSETVNKFGKKLDVFLKKKKFEGFELTKNIQSMFDKPNVIKSEIGNYEGTEKQSQELVKADNFYSYAERKMLFNNPHNESLESTTKLRNGLNLIMKSMDSKVKHSMFNRKSFDYGDPFSLSETASIDTVKKSFRLPSLQKPKTKKVKLVRDQILEKVLDNDMIRHEADKAKIDAELNIEEILTRVKTKTNLKLQNELKELMNDRQSQLRLKIQSEFKKTLQKEQEEKEEKEDTFVSLQKIFRNISTQI